MDENKHPSKKFLSRHDETSRDMSRPVETELDTSRYSLTAEAASFRFARAGVPRSPRSVMRYCANGHLDCVKIETEKNERYLVTPESVEKRIEELLSAAVSRHDETSREEPHPKEEREAHSSIAAEGRVSDELRKENEELKRENFDLKITNRGKDEFIKLMREERAQFIDQVSQQAHRIGELEERLRLPARASMSNASVEDAATESHRQSADSIRDSSPESIHRTRFGDEHEGGTMGTSNTEG